MLLTCSKTFEKFNNIKIYKYLEYLAKSRFFSTIACLSVSDSKPGFCADSMLICLFHLKFYIFYIFITC